ncbi:MAG: hypothetical protein O7F73_13880 [Gammaproteobacteria bacterium]|nr:hypothetical protein [Gammaproteobacteria bacterium]
MPSPTDSITRVGVLLQAYAEKGVFRGFSSRSETPARADYRILWHRDQVFELRYEPRQSSLRFACVLPEVDPGSSMYREFRAWLKLRRSDELPEHRRCDPRRVRIKPYNRGGAVALTLRSLDGDMDYAVRRLIALVHEIYLEFLSSGLYHDWLIETFDLDPDNPC